MNTKHTNINYSLDYSTSMDGFCQGGNEIGSPFRMANQNSIVHIVYPVRDVFKILVRKTNNKSQIIFYPS